MNGKYTAAVIILGLIFGELLGMAVAVETGIGCKCETPTGERVGLHSSGVVVMSLTDNIRLPPTWTCSGENCPEPRYVKGFILTPASSYLDLYVNTQKLYSCITRNGEVVCRKMQEEQK